MKYIFCLILTIFVFIRCQGDDVNNGGGSGNGVGQNTRAGSSISLTSDTLSGSALSGSQTERGTACSVQLDIYQGSGLCITPLNFIGYANNLVGENSKISDPDIGQARLAGVSGSTDAEGLIFNGAEFNLAEKSSFTGYNELWFNYEHKTEFSHLRLDLSYQKIHFRILDQYVTMMIVASDQPFSESQALDDCSLSAEEKSQSRYTKADLITGLSFKRGDYLFCVRSDSESCDSSEFMWLDSDSGKLVATRPASPRKHQWLVNDPVSCSKEGDRPQISLTGMVFGATLTSPVTLYADWSHGVNSIQYKDGASPLSTSPLSENKENDTDTFEEPYPLYYASIDGVSQEGSRLSQTYDFDLSGMIFIEGLAEGELEDYSTEQLLAKVWTKHDWVFEQKAKTKTVGYSIDQISSATATPSIALSGGTERPD
ncbi:MAG: hypothetical protein H6618_07605 [Deltaproteobacteria bacterium]|nr:hypothetical protein [Deltaproteobacteria bacterium]